MAKTEFSPHAASRASPLPQPGRISKIEFTPHAMRDLERADRRSQERICAILERVRIEPLRHAKKLAGTPYLRLRAGDWRIIFEMDKDTLVVLKIGKRENIYDF